MEPPRDVVDKAIDAIYCLNADERLREQIRVQRKAELDYGNDMAVARDEGIAIGEARGIAIGRAEGRAEGMAKGIAKGKAEGKAEAYSEFIDSLRLSGFSEEQIKKIVGDRYQS